MCLNLVARHHRVGNEGKHDGVDNETRRRRATRLGNAEPVRDIREDGPEDARKNLVYHLVRKRRRDDKEEETGREGGGSLAGEHHFIMKKRKCLGEK
jgi:hypothetical protein